MNGAMEFLLWTKGPMLNLALGVFALGVGVRLIEILILGRAKNYADPRAPEWIGGARTVLSRTLPDPGTFQRAPFDVLVGWIWHIGFILVLLFFVPHVELIRGILGFAWPALPTPVVDFLTAITILGLIAALVHRLTHPVKRYLSTAEDYLVWAVVFMVALTGYLSYHRLISPYPLALGMHILSAEIFLILIPFTRLSHLFTAFIARWYTGTHFGRKGVEA
ncbi:respiratory nitrate reductase subunit gamma [Caldichromatium japonicum]|uniref:Respiratory nitrate reductase subunit gamma n=1 Tax=Caldichromatium japonicum TaxID=2699430 RepID=A0A6G7VBR2_9GAMM|nr:respiratory nitrate reductase subunit gamma [Caldichromatium japonicum]QIK37315.1 respiratory nitrate reductase subunit gamma [Caldichromatium japonicum]